MGGKSQKSKKSKRPDTRPGRSRYWSSGRLAKNKVRNLVRHNGFASEAEAAVFWRSVRSKRIKKAG